MCVERKGLDSEGSARGQKDGQKDGVLTGTRPTDVLIILTLMFLHVYAHALGLWGHMCVRGQLEVDIGCPPTWLSTVFIEARSPELELADSS